MAPDKMEASFKRIMERMVEKEYGKFIPKPKFQKKHGNKEVKIATLDSAEPARIEASF